MLKIKQTMQQSTSVFNPFRRWGKESSSGAVLGRRVWPHLKTSVCYANHFWPVAIQEQIFEKNGCIAFRQLAWHKH